MAEMTKKELEGEVTISVKMPSPEHLQKLEELEPGYSLTPAYRTQEAWNSYLNQPVRCIFLGTKEIPNSEGELITCSVFAGIDGVFLAAQMVLVEATRDLLEGTPIQITYQGKKKNQDGKSYTNKFEVRKLV